MTGDSFWHWRPALDPLATCVLAAEKIEDHQECAHGYSRIGDIKRGPYKGAGVQLEKIGYAAMQQPVEQIPRRSPGDQRETRLAPRVSCPARKQ